MHLLCVIHKVFIIKGLQAYGKALLFFAYLEASAYLVEKTGCISRF